MHLPTFQGLLRPESSFRFTKRIGEGRSQEISSVLQGNYLREGHCLAKQGPSDSGRRPASPGKGDSAGFRGSTSPALSGCLHISPFRILGHSFPINALTLTAHTLSWEFDWHCNSATWRMIFWLWFSEILALWL